METKLEHKYVVWAMVKQQKHMQQQVDMSQTYISENKPVAEFQTVGEFWQVYSHFRRPSVMPLGTFLHFFVDGVKPLWEDPACKNGGRWSIRTPKTHTAKFWEDLVLAMIGEQFDAPSGEVLGLVLSLKFNNDTISVWHRNANDDAISQQLKNSIESQLDMQDGMRFEHEIFEEVLNAPPKEKTPKQRDD